MKQLDWNIQNVIYLILYYSYTLIYLQNKSTITLLMYKNIDKHPCVRTKMQ